MTATCGLFAHLSGTHSSDTPGTVWFARCRCEVRREISFSRRDTSLIPTRSPLAIARRFAEYKRPNLLLHDADRLARLLCHPERPVQLIVAGKAHPQDEEGKHLVHAFTRFAARADVWDRVVFLEDYDIALAQHLVSGIDVWLNTPRRPWEACGTSGMKILVNGGLNLSELDGWWAEAYSPEIGWALGDGREHHEPEHDAVEATRLYEILEQQVIPEFYERDRAGVPTKLAEAYSNQHGTSHAAVQQ